MYLQRFAGAAIGISRLLSYRQQVHEMPHEFDRIIEIILRVFEGVTAGITRWLLDKASDSHTKSGRRKR